MARAWATTGALGAVYLSCCRREWLQVWSGACSLGGLEVPSAALTNAPVPTASGSWSPVLCTVPWHSRCAGPPLLLCLLSCQNHLTGQNQGLVGTPHELAPPWRDARACVFCLLFAAGGQCGTLRERLPSGMLIFRPLRAVPPQSSCSGAHCCPSVPLLSKAPLGVRDGRQCCSRIPPNMAAAMQGHDMAGALLARAHHMIRGPAGGRVSRFPVA